ncbi:MAG: DUF429 domain-containing protein [Bacillota bacterium]
MAFYVGVDGCKAGWFAVALAENDAWDAAVFPDVVSLWERFKDAVLILVDVPIGLRDRGPEERACDLEARRLLKWPRRSSVFRVPCRSAVYASTWEEASRINEELTGKRFPKQSWGIVRKIREVDEFLETHGEARFRLRETHPEVCFWALAGRPMEHRKKTHAGFEERLEVLRSVCPAANTIVQRALSGWRRSQVVRDDVLDALVAAVSAKMGAGELTSLPATSECDSKGLQMEIVYPALGRICLKDVGG